MRLSWGFALAAVLALTPATIASAQIQLNISLAYVNSNDGVGDSTVLPNVSVPGANGTFLSQVNLTPSGPYVNHVFNVYASVSGLTPDQNLMFMEFGATPSGGVTAITAGYTPNVYTIDPPPMGTPVSDAPPAPWCNDNGFNGAAYVVGVTMGTSTGGAQGNTFGDYAAALQLGQSTPFLIGQQVLTCNSSGGYSFQFRPNGGYLQVISGNTDGAAANTFALSYPAYSGFGDSALFAPRGPTDLTWADGAVSTWAVADGTQHWVQTASPSTPDDFYHLDTVRFTDAAVTNRTVTLAGNLNPTSVIVNSTGDYTFTGSGAIVGTGTTLVKQGAGKLTVGNTGTNAYTGLTTVQGGTLQLNGASAQNPVLNLGGADLQAGQLVFDYSAGGSATNPITAIRGALLSGTLYSSTAPAGVRIGYWDSGTAVTAKPVLAGDVNGDGVVNITDLGLLAANWNLTGKYWADGDFNYDGTVNISDLGLLAANWNKSYTSPGALPGLSFSQGLAAVGLTGGVVAPVPEPGTLALLVLAALGLGARLWIRRQRG